MSATCAGSSVIAICPIAPSPFFTGASRTAFSSSSSMFSAAWSRNSPAASSYSYIEPPSRPVSCTARLTMVCRTVSRSSVELIACPTSPSAVSCPTDLVSASVRDCNSLNSRTFSIAITAWSAKVLSRS